MTARTSTEMSTKLLPVAAAALMTMAGSAGCDDGRESADEAGSVLVTHDGASVEVDLGDLSAMDLGDGEGEVYVRLDVVVRQAELGVELTSLEADFVASDGFTPRDSSNCTDDLVPIPGSSLVHGHIHRQTRQLVWSEDVDYPGCLAVGDTAEILLAEAEEEEAGTVEVVYDGTSLEVDLSTLEVTSEGGVDRISLVDIVEAAALAVATADLLFDFVASDGFRPGASSNCVDFVPVAGESLSDGFILPGSRNLSWEESLDFPSCMFVDDVATIEASNG